MKRLSEWNHSKWVVLALSAGLFGLMLTLNILTPYICDDFTYVRNFDTGLPLQSLWEIIPSMAAHSRYMNGRLVAHGLAQVFVLTGPLVFDVVNAAVFTLTLLLACRLCGRKPNALLFAAMFCLLWLWMPVFGQVALWQVGAVNYFWSLSALLVFIAPALLRLMERRNLLKKKWHWALFCVYGFFFGWYSEIASFVGICMVVCLIVLDVWMNGKKLKLYRFTPVLTAVLGYVTMLLMPAQTANKQAGGLTPELLAMRFAGCTRMLLEHLMPLLVIFTVLFVMGLILRLSAKTMVLAGLFALAGICANYMPIAASYYPERCMCTTVLMLIMASGFLVCGITDSKVFPVLCAACAVLYVLTVPAGITGCRDILSCYRQHVQREEAIAAAIAEGTLDVAADAVTPLTPWSGYWGVRDLVTDPNDWPNHSMALYYGLDSLTGK